MPSPPDTLELQSAFRAVMAAVCTPVSVVTALEDDRPFGTTVSAFLSLSMTPPMVLVAFDRGSELLAVVQSTGAFGLNVLSSAQSHLALVFARKGGTAKFAGIAWDNDGGVPRLSGNSGFVACSVARAVDGGDHIVLLGEVRSAQPSGGPPLSYHNRVFGTHSPLEIA
ncbi:flavin reductase family protein [Mycobacterium colombiense]|uniref:flavin reductase family protein n=1 Tax=Mycobacterium colombiense TaxID=339268 RepID=UPI00200ABCEE|nr:flavin reductase family protein [Mycobacterium colombiense]MCK8646711.1 flavin reductase family protein [Mycobacterium colombiense]